MKRFYFGLYSSLIVAIAIMSATTLIAPQPAQAFGDICDDCGGLDYYSGSGLDYYSGDAGIDYLSGSGLDYFGDSGLDFYGGSGLDYFADNSLDYFGGSGLDYFGEQGGVATFYPEGGVATFYPEGGVATFYPEGGVATFYPQGGSAGGYSTPVSTPGRTVTTGGGSYGYSAPRTTSYSTPRTSVTPIRSTPPTYTVSTPQPPIYYPPTQPPVYPPVQPPVTYPRPTCTIIATPTSVPVGGNATITWSSYGATSATISGIGNVAVSGSRSIPNITSTRVYTMTVTGQGGTGTCTGTVAVYTTPIPPVITQPSCTITAAQTHVGLGQYTTITWRSYNATSASISGIGSVALNGTRSVQPNGTVTYTMTVRSANGGINTCNTTISHVSIPPIQPPVIYPPVYPPVQPPIYPHALSCTLSANPTAIQNGQSAILSWSSYGAVSAWLNDGLGSVSTNGSLTVRPESSRHYTLTIRDQYGNQQTCAANLTVSGGLPYVSLSSIPYTGIDLGIMGSILYWGALMAWAAAAAYLIVGHKGGIMGLAYGIMAQPRRVRPDAVILNETIYAKEQQTAQDSPMTTDTSNEDIIAEAVMKKAQTTDAMRLEVDGDGKPRITITRA